MERHRPRTIMAPWLVSEGAVRPSAKEQAFRLGAGRIVSLTRAWEFHAHQGGLSFHLNPGKAVRATRQSPSSTSLLKRRMLRLYAKRSSADCKVPGSKAEESGREVQLAALDALAHGLARGSRLPY